MSVCTMPMEAAKIAVSVPMIGDGQQGAIGGAVEDGVGARHHVNTGGDHGCGMDQG